MSDDKWIERFENKMDKQDEKLEKVTVDLTEIKSNLKEHMRRTYANEETNILLQKLVTTNQKDSDTRLSKLEKVKDNLHFLGWVLGGLLSLIEIFKRLGFF